MKAPNTTGRSGLINGCNRRKFLKLAGSAGLGLGAAGFAAESQADTSGRPAGPLAQDFAKVFHNSDRARYVDGPGIAKLGDGTLVAVVPVVPRAEGLKGKVRSGKSSTTHVLQSRDAGRSWQPVAQLPYYVATPWQHRGALYLFAMPEGTEFRNDDLELLRSTDGGRSWSKPVVLCQGHFWNCPSGMVIRDDRLYWAFDDLGLGAKRGPRVIAGDLSRDPMDPRSWRISDPIPYPGAPKAMVNPTYLKHYDKGRYLEPNVIEVAGKLRVMLCVKPANYYTTGLSAVCDLNDQSDRLDFAFTQFHPRPGGQQQFNILWDERSRMFWSLANLAVDSEERYGWFEAARKQGNYDGTGGKDRRFLMLFYGVDGLNWFQAGCVAQAAKLSQSFNYPHAIVDGDDLAIIARASINAPSQHDADHATFHRVRDFRRLALNLVPES